MEADTTPQRRSRDCWLNQTMSNIYIVPSNFHQMMIDATAFFTHMTPELFLLILVVVTGVIYLINREKAALCVAISGAIYLLPFLITGHIL